MIPPYRTPLPYEEYPKKEELTGRVKSKTIKNGRSSIDELWVFMNYLKRFRIKKTFQNGYKQYCIQKRFLFFYFKWYTGCTGDAMTYKLYDDRETCQTIVDYLNAD